jgi:predicted DsbA family dithiol-disulfide isomerase
MCPFCYIGKRHLEQALLAFEGRDAVEITWKSYQLDPEIPMKFDSPVGVYARRLPVCCGVIFNRIILQP